MADAVEVGGGALKGAAEGASIGSTFGPWGTAIGGIAGGLIGGVDAFVSGEHKEKAEQILKDAVAKQQDKVNEFGKWYEENSGITANNRAYEQAKAQTGTMTSQTSQSQAYAAQNAQENAGISKSQAAMSGQNAAAGKIQEVYDEQMNINKQAADKANEDMVTSKQDALNKELTAIKDKAQADAEYEASRNLLTDVVDKAKDLGSNVVNKVKSIGGGIVSGIKSFFSDEDLKRMMAVTPEDTYTLLTTTVRNYTPVTNAEKTIYDNATRVVALMEKVYGYK